MWVRSFPASPSGYRLSALDEARWTPDGIPHACGYMVVVGVLGVAKSRMAAGQRLGRCKLRTSPMWRAIFESDF